MCIFPGRFMLRRSSATPAKMDLCVDRAALKFAKPPCTGQLIPATELSGNMTPANQDLYDRLIDAFSMRSYVPTPGLSGHDQFFATFARFGGLDKRHTGEWVDEVASRAAAQNQQYLELMETPAFGHAAQIAHDDRLDPRGRPETFAHFRQQLLDQWLARRGGRRTAWRRVQAEAGGAAWNTAERRRLRAACPVEMRYIYQVLRGYPPEQVFAQTLLGFETVQACDGGA